MCTQIHAQKNDILKTQDKLQLTSWFLPSLFLAAESHTA